MMTARRLFASVALSLTLAQTGFAQSSKPALTVYTYSSFAGEYGPGSVIKTRFEERCDCTLDWVESDDAATLLARLKLEGSSTRADVVLGLDTSLLAEANATNLFAPHGIATGTLDIPVAWTEPNFLPFDWGWFAFVYDSTKMTNPPTSLAALVDAAQGPKVIIEDPRTSTPGLGLLLWMRAVYGDDAGAAWRKLAPRIVTVTQGWSEAYGLFLKGEADMVLSYTTSPAYHISQESETKYKAASFAEGHYLQVEVAGMTTATDTPELARSFMQFILSRPFQDAIPEGNWMYPARAPDSHLPASFRALSKPAKTLSLEPREISTNRRTWVDEWLAALSR